MLPFFSFENKRSDQIIQLKWNKAYEAEKWWNIKTGLLWSFSFIGAELPLGAFDKSIQFNADSTVFEIDFSKLGFTARTLALLEGYNGQLKSSYEYKKFNSIDLGRWLVYVIYSGNHYYQLVDAPKTLTEFKKLHPQPTENFLVNKSAVSVGKRKIEFHTDSNWFHQFYIAHEGKYDSLVGAFEAQEYETIDFLPNTQTRFAIYDKKGNLKLSSDTTFSKAGKIGKCIWCHESKIEKLFTGTLDYKGFLTREEFEYKVAKMNDLIFEQRKKSSTDLAWFNRFDHTQSELLYISFMQSSAKRIATEWQVSEMEVTQLVKTFKAVPFDEFPFLGNLYPRKLIDSLSNHEVTRVADFVREPSAFEPE